MVSREITLTFDELLRRPLIEDYVTLCCVSNPVGGPYIGNALWLGASLAACCARPGSRPGPTSCCAPRWTVHLRHPDPDGDGRPGRAARGGDEWPAAAGRARLPGPDGGARALRLRVGDQVGDGHQGHPFAATTPYWAQRGWSSRRRSRPSGASTCRTPGRDPGRRRRWPGWHGPSTRGSRPSRCAWTRAVAWPAGRRPRPGHLAAVGLGLGRHPGGHVLEARATDKTGSTQTAVQAPPEPDGATGSPMVSVPVRLEWPVPSAGVREVSGGGGGWAGRTPAAQHPPSGSRAWRPRRSGIRWPTPSTRLTTAVASFCDSGAVVLNGYTTATRVASPMIQPKKTRGYGWRSAAGT